MSERLHEIGAEGGMLHAIRKDVGLNRWRHFRDEIFQPIHRGHPRTPFAKFVPVKGITRGEVHHNRAELTPLIGA
jgi:hypothetical protein